MSARGGLKSPLPAAIWAEPRRFVELILGEVATVDRDDDGVYLVVLVSGDRVRLDAELSRPEALRSRLDQLGRLDGVRLPLATARWLRGATRRLYWQRQRGGMAS